MEELLGIGTEPGGRHMGLGTRNRLVGLGGDRYLEVVGVDPDQPAPDRARWFGLDELDGPKLVTWCAKSSELDALVARGRAAGVDLGDPVQGSRMRTDGTPLEWRFTDPWADRLLGVVPFFIDWGDTVHPGRTLAPGCTFESLRVEHPDPEHVGAILAALDLDTEVREAQAARIVATLDTPNGTVELS